jgi:hypothetical protein
MQFIYTMEFYNAIKNRIMSFAGKCMERDIIVLSEISQRHKAKYSMFSLMWNPWIKQKKDMKLNG